MRFSEDIGTMFWIAALSYFPTANAVALNLPERSFLQRPSNSSVADFANVTSLSEFNNPRFNAQIDFGNVRLRPTSMLMNGVEALATLALKDQTARSSGAQFHAEGYPDVVIDIEPQQPATDVLNEIMLLCIFSGMDHVIREREYRNAKVLCFWDNVVVAQVLFERPGYQSSANTTDVLSPTAESPGGYGNISSLITTTNDTLLEAVTPRFYFRPDSQSLPTPNVFGTVITVLLAFAYLPNTDPVEAYTVVRTGAEWDVSMLFEPTLIRTRPPYFEYRWAIETVRQMPGFLLEQGRFAELSIGVIVDGVHVGNALLEKGEPNDLEEKAGEAAVRV